MRSDLKGDGTRRSPAPRLKICGRTQTQKRLVRSDRSSPPCVTASLSTHRHKHKGCPTIESACVQHHENQVTRGGQYTTTERGWRVLEILSDPARPVLVLRFHIGLDGRASNESLEEGVADSHADERCRRVAENARQQGGEDLLPRHDENQRGRGQQQQQRQQGTW